ncbi:hypothetical protein GCM10010327_13020 [Streptomyces nitrosporeus]|nr:hypothetical protein GCM10010327_13020 [Streptomyces nitrosporeus]
MPGLSVLTVRLLPWRITNLRIPASVPDTPERPVSPCAPGPRPGHRFTSSPDTPSPTCENLESYPEVTALNQSVI